jgi:hypothetical protein
VTSDTILISTKCTVPVIYIHLMRISYMFLCLCTIIREEKLCQLLVKPTIILTNFTFMWPCIVTNFFKIKPTRYTNFTNLFWRETLNVSDSSSAHHQEFIQCTFEQNQDWSCSQVVYKPVWHIPLLSIQWINSWWWADELPETCRVSWQNKFVKLLHLVGFITRKLLSWHS